VSRGVAQLRLGVGGRLDDCPGDGGEIVAVVDRCRHRVVGVLSLLGVDL
jgi:hypothetical protein